MATEEDARSDVSGSEKPVREKLEKASIDTDPQEIASSTDNATLNADDTPEVQNGAAGSADSPSKTTASKLEKKRSHEDMEDDPTVDSQPTAHVRKRSRDDTSEEREIRPGTPAPEADVTNGEDVALVSSPKLKKTRHGDLETNGSTTDKSVDAAVSETVQSAQAEAIPDSTESVRTTASDTVASAPQSEEAATGTDYDGTSTKDMNASARLSPTSGFANTSNSSPFGALAGENTTLNAKSPFASGAFGAAAGAATSGFATIGKTSGVFGSGGGFATSTKNSLNSNGSTMKEASGSAFGGAASQKSAFTKSPATGSAFGAAAASGFGKLGAGTANGFSSGLGGSGFGSLVRSGGLTSFASGKPATQIGGTAKSAKPFGALADDEDEVDDGEDEDDDAAGFKSPAFADEEKQDERFFEQDIETGEEDEITTYTCRAKLYNFGVIKDEKKAWKERGHGTIRLNVKRVLSGAEEVAPQARLVMRVDGSHKVALNTPVKKEIKFGAPKGGPPEGPYIFFMGAIINEDGKSEGLELLQLKVKPQYALDLHEMVVKLQEAM